METLKKFFPYSFGAADVAALVIKIVVYIAASIVVGALSGIIAWSVGFIPVVGGLISIVSGLVGSLASLYATAGVVIAILVYCKVIK